MNRHWKEPNKEMKKGLRARIFSQITFAWSIESQPVIFLTSLIGQFLKVRNIFQEDQVQLHNINKKDTHIQVTNMLKVRPSCRGTKKNYEPFTNFLHLFLDFYNFLSTFRWDSTKW
jgi:hypothetical protein